MEVTRIARYKDYILFVDSRGSCGIYKEVDNFKKFFKAIAEEVDYEPNPNYSNRQKCKKLIDLLEKAELDCAHGTVSCYSRPTSPIIMSDLEYSFSDEYGNHNLTVTVNGAKDVSVDKLVIPDTAGSAAVEAIARDAFRSCKRLIRVSLPDRLLKYYEAFADTPVYDDVRRRYIEHVSSLAIADRQDFPQYTSCIDDVFAHSQKLTEAWVPDVTELLGTFKDCVNLSRVVLPRKLRLMPLALQGCSSLTKIRIPASVENADSALQDCDGLKEVIMDGEYTGGDMFGNRPNLSLERIVCLSLNPTIIGAAPNATLYVPYMALDAYKKAIAEFDCSPIAEGLPAMEYADIKMLCLYDGDEPDIKNKASEDGFTTITHEDKNFKNAINRINDFHERLRQSAKLPLKITKSDVMDTIACKLDEYFSSKELAERLFYSEAEFQLDLAIWLEKNVPDIKAHPEYYVPLKNICGNAYPWDNDGDRANIDIVAEIEGYYVLIELKYITASVSSPQYVFGEKIGDQSLTNIHAKHRLYEIWRDVKRIELAHKFCNNVAGGFAIVLTNQKSIYEPQKAGTDFEDFAITEGRSSTNHPLDSKDKHYRGRETIKCGGQTVSKYPDISFVSPYRPIEQSTCYADKLLSETDPKFHVNTFRIP